MTDANTTLTAAKAAFPELWPEEDAMQVVLQQHGGPGGLTIARQEVLDRVQRALDAVEGNDEDTIPPGTESITLQLPKDAKMVQQALAIVMYIDSEGRVAYSVRTIGEGVISSWLGMNVLTQNHLLRRAGLTDEED